MSTPTTNLSQDVPASADVKLAIEKERLALDQQKLTLEQQKLAIEQQKIALEQQKLELERDKFARARWWHEDGLVNNRLTWLLVSQALLFAAFGAVSKAPNSLSTKLSSAADGLIDLLPLIGTLIASAVLVATMAACWAQYKLSVELRSGLGVSAVTTLLGWAPSLLLPLIFAWAWHALSAGQ